MDTVTKKFEKQANDILEANLSFKERQEKLQEFYKDVEAQGIHAVTFLSERIQKERGNSLVNDLTEATHNIANMMGILVNIYQENSKNIVVMDTLFDVIENQSGYEYHNKVSFSSMEKAKSALPEEYQKRLVL